MERFNFFATAEEAYQANLEMITLAFRKLKRGGYFIMKSMDVRCKAHTLWLNAYIQVEAMKLGFVMVDLFILATKSRMLSYRGEKQNHARKYHSYFLYSARGTLYQYNLLDYDDTIKPPYQSPLKDYFDTVAILTQRA